MDLGFTIEDRIENLRRVGEISKILYDSGVYVLASFISPFARDRRNIKELFRDEDFIEIYVKCDIDSLQKRDPKGLYKKALSGDIPNFASGPPRTLDFDSELVNPIPGFNLKNIFFGKHLLILYNELIRL